MNMNKFRIVVAREYAVRVKKKSFILFTLLTPLILILFMVVIVLLMTSQREGDEKSIIVLDQTGKYAQHLSNTEEFKFIRGDKQLDEYRRDNESEAYAYLLISDDLVEHPEAISIHSRKQLTGRLEEHIRNDLTPVVRDEKIASFNIPNLKKIMDDSKVRLDISSIRWAKDGKETSVSTAFAYAAGQIFNALIYLFIIVYGMMVMQSVREEKKNRVVEIIVSSVKPRTLLFGKIVGVGLVGLTQMLIWAVVLVIAFVVMQLIFLSSVTFDTATLNQSIASSQVDPAMVSDLQTALGSLESLNLFGLGLAFIFLFICGYLIYASLFAAIGASIDNDEDANQLIMPISFILIIAFYLGFFTTNNPDSSIAVWGSMIPFTSPMVMMVRLLFDPPVWQVILSFLILIASTFGLVWLAAKIFRVGILMYGKKPRLKEMGKWVRYK